MTQEEKNIVFKIIVNNIDAYETAARNFVEDGNHEEARISLAEASGAIKMGKQILDLIINM